MKYLACDEYFYQFADMVQITIAGVQDNREVFTLVEDSKKYWQKRGEEKYIGSLMSVSSNPKVHFEELSPYTQYLAETSIEENSKGVSVPKFEIENIADREGKTFEDAMEAIKKDIENAVKQGIDLHIEYENGKFSVPDISSIDFPLGYSEEMGIAGKKDYANAGMLYQQRSDEDIAENIADVLMRNMSGTNMNYHIASVIAEESVDRMHSGEDVETAVKGIISDMTYGCNSGNITEMIYSNDIDKFFEKYEENVRKVVSEHLTPHDMPDMENWAIEGKETKQWMAKSAYEITVAMFDNSREWNKHFLREIELYEEKPKDRKEVKNIIVEQGQGNNLKR